VPAGHRFYGWQSAGADACRLFLHRFPTHPV
jgi:hypothetical protein